MATASDGKRLGLLDVLEPILASHPFLRVLVLDRREVDAAKRLSVLVRSCKTTAQLCTSTSNPVVPGACTHTCAPDAHTHHARARACMTGISHKEH